MSPIALIAPLLFGSASVQVQGMPDPRDPMPMAWKQPGFAKFYWIQSPNFGPRPVDAVVDTVVVHATVIPTLEATTGAFNRESSQVSAHYTIDRDGSYVMHVSTFDRAWHAGVSLDARGKTNLNNFSIGIELVNLNDGKDPWPEAQVTVLKWIIAGLKRRFPLKQIVSHEFIAVPSGRKSDPTNFPWSKLESLGLPMYFGKNPNAPKPDGFQA
jgi:N-acetyl-anhydromuramyl-L-alanine amidase AmpD